MTHDDPCDGISRLLMATINSLSDFITNAPESFVSTIGYTNARDMLESANRLAVCIEERLLVTANDYDLYVPDDEKDDLFLLIMTDVQGFGIEYGEFMSSCEEIGVVDGEAGATCREWFVRTQKSDEEIERLLVRDEGVISWMYVDEKEA